MKISKILSIILTLAICFCFAGCAGSEGDNASLSSVEPLAHTVNIVGYAEKGEIPEIPYALGHNIEDLKETFMSHIDEGSEIVELVIDEGENDVWMNGGSMTFCYEKKNKENVRWLPWLIIIVAIVVIAILVVSHFSLEPNNVIQETGTFSEILWNTRQADLLGLIFVVLTGAFAIVVLFKERRKK